MRFGPRARQGWRRADGAICMAMAIWPLWDALAVAAYLAAPDSACTCFIDPRCRVDTTFSHYHDILSNVKTRCIEDMSSLFVAANTHSSTTGNARSRPTSKLVLCPTCPRISNSQPLGLCAHQLGRLARTIYKHQVERRFICQRIPTYSLSRQYCSSSCHFSVLVRSNDLALIPLTSSGSSPSPSTLARASSSTSISPSPPPLFASSIRRCTLSSTSS